jgi:hypothetical protein
MDSGLHASCHRPWTSFHSFQNGVRPTGTGVSDRRYRSREEPRSGQIFFSDPKPKRSKRGRGPGRRFVRPVLLICSMSHDPALMDIKITRGVTALDHLHACLSPVIPSRPLGNSILDVLPASWTRNMPLHAIRESFFQSPEVRNTAPTSDLTTLCRYFEAPLVLDPEEW